MAKRPKTGSWIVEMRRTVTTEVVCSECTEAEAQADPWSYAVSDDEIECIVEKVLSVRPND